MDDMQLQSWFNANKALLENAYLEVQEPWQQSGVGLGGNRDAAYWEVIRRPIADCIGRAGSFLDIGCANGYLLECVMRWVGERGIEIVPYGLDYSDQLAEMARQRLPGYADHIFAGNAWDWQPPRRFTFVRTELVYVPQHLHAAYVKRLIDQFLEPDGMLLVADYQAHGNEEAKLNVDSYLSELGFSVEATRSAFWQGVEKTRIAVVGHALFGLQDNVG